jgi:uncharacterized protein (TIRG00374 family)
VERLRKLAGSFWFRLAVSAALLAAVATRIDLGDARSRIAAGSWLLYALAVAVLFASFVLAALRWGIFLRAAGLATEPRQALRAYLIGVFTMNFLPTQVGGDVVRTYIVSRPGTRVLAGATVVLDRVTALGCLLVLGFLAAASDPSAVPGSLLVALAAATGVLAATTALVASVAQLSGRLANRVPSRLRSWGGAAAEGTRACLRRGVLARSVVLGLAFQVLVVFSLWLVADSLRMHLTLPLLAVVFPLTLLISMLPVSIGGLGVREWSYVILLGRVGVDVTDATVLSLAMAVANAAAGLPGAAMLLVRTRAPVIAAGAAERGAREPRLLVKGTRTP